MVAGLGKLRGEGIVKNFRKYFMYTLLYLKWITNKDPLLAKGTLLKQTNKKPIKKTRAQSLALPLAAHAALSKLFNFFVPWLPHL